MDTCSGTKRRWRNKKEDSYRERFGTCEEDFQSCEEFHELSAQGVGDRPTFGELLDRISSCRSK